MDRISALHRRRDRLSQSLPDGSLVILAGAKRLRRNGDCDYPFRQHSHFWYLTGHDQPEALFALEVRDNAHKAYLWIPYQSAEEALWEGPRPSVTEVAEHTGITAVAYQHEVDSHLRKLMRHATHVFTNDLTPMPEVAALVHRGRHHDVSQHVDTLRLYKDPYEIACIQQAVDQSTQAHHRLMAEGKPDSHEWLLTAQFQYETARQGARSLAYDTIVAAGERACTLHYTQANQPIQTGDLVLVDAGCEYQGYAADITRTWPASGYFSTPQRELYEAVLHTQSLLIDAIRPGVTWQALQQQARVSLVTQCVAMGLFLVSVDECLERQYDRDVFMHGFGHWLGLDVHDTSACRSSHPELAKDMVLTVEPGLYIPRNHAQISPTWWGLGVRIEDDVQVTQTGCINLTAACMKDVEDMETWIQQHR